ncbi:hypothetical protein KDA23_05690 [Candidatus Saccharibacteria bacterium]|nr:hypothetical protein [Candidatus Saccharibacteria bacterium]
MSNYDKLTLSEIRTAVRGKLDDDSYDADLIDEAANDFQNELFTNHRIRSMESSDTINISADDYTIDFPVDFLTMLELTIIDSSSNYENIKDGYLNYNQFMRDHANFSVATATRPRQWTEFGGGARFTAPSDAAYTANIDYLRLPELMVNDSDESEVRKVWKEMFTIGTLARVMEINEDYAEASQERDKLDPLVTAFVAREGRGQIKTGPIIMSTRRGRKTLGSTRSI